ncbi:hypothetical protein GCM10008967_37600 [Bacillus carboniphilus]|uniref:Uncharacterized protein n=1 Tax=Bacillus carboniphilus TaxID=86663 RepID=A0ABP3GEN1_9BACI
MHIGNEGIYPNCPFITRTIEVGGLTKQQLIKRLQEYSILLNQYGETLLNDKKFPISDSKYTMKTVEISVGNLGFPEGATTAHIFNKARDLGLELYPLEFGPYLRLEYLDQPEGDSGNTAASSSNRIYHSSIEDTN